LERSVKIVRVHTERAFAIARSSADTFERVIFEMSEDGVAGRGEAAPTSYYGQDAEGVAAALEGAEVGDPWDIQGALARNGEMPPSALTALDNAMHDLAARRLSMPVYRLLGLARPEPVSAYTLGIADRETTVAYAKGLRAHRILKVKVGGWKDVETLRAVREASEAELWVDANEAFSPEEAVEVVTELKEIGVGMIEQPVPVSAGPEALRGATDAALPVPVIADESAISARDVPGLAGCQRGQRQARQVRWDPAGAGDDPHSPRPRDARYARLHGRDLARHLGRSPDLGPRRLRRPRRRDAPRRRSLLGTGLR
jgi:L-alanine-DL-glutamate epimerase-like enolase superfamily enzyme